MGLATVVVIILGVIGNDIDAKQAKAEPGTPIQYAADLLYRTLQLFVLEINPRHYPVNPILEAARWLAGIVAGIALFRAAAEIFRQQLDQRKLRLLKDHTIVCGLGRKGFQLVQQLHQRRTPVVVVEIDEGDDSIPTCRAMGITVLVGDATTDHLLRKAGVPRASRLIAVCRDDSVNIEIAMQARRIVAASKRDASRPLACYIHIIDLKLAELFRQHKIFSCGSDPFEARIFSFYDNSARDLLMRNPLDVDPHRDGGDSETAHLVIIGFGQMGESVALQAARIGHFASGKRLRITIIDPAADERRQSLLARYPQLEQVVELAFESRSIEHPDVRQQLSAWATSSDQRLILAICVDDDPQALSIALNLPPVLRDAETPVFVRQSEQKGLATLLNDRLTEGPAGLHVTSFGAPEVSAGLEQILQEKLDVLARAIHERYVAHRKADGAADGSDLAMQPWSQLDAGLKSSNRQQADHIDVKLRAIHCRRIGAKDPVPAGAQPFTGFSPDEVELLARMEHARWCADRLLAGWQLGEKADKPRRISPHLVPFDQLTEEIKQYDRDAVLQIPELVALAGERIVRLG